MKKAGAEWGKMSDKEKEPYLKKQEKDQERYICDIFIAVGMTNNFSNSKKRDTTSEQMEVNPLMWRKLAKRGNLRLERKATRSLQQKMQTRA